jgi:regulatory protein
MKRFTAARPLNNADLRQFALTYVSRYATSRHKLADYLRRKLRERGWDGEAEPPVDALVAELAENRFVDDRAYAGMKADGLTRRGYGPRRVRQALDAAGIEEDDAAEALQGAEADSMAAALAYAKRRRLGPFSPHPDDPDRRRKALAAMLRAGHAYLTARRILDLSPELVQDGRALSEL